MLKALVCGAGGFIGNHLVSRFKSDGYWFRGVDNKSPEFSRSDADEFVVRDLRDPSVCHEVVDLVFTEVYQLAADTGERDTCFL
ncbi:MAG: NAD-dependent epimerase/dehydratase family protein [Arenicellales bacterium]